MLLAAVLVPLTLSQASVNLKYVPPIGKPLRYRMVMDVKQGMGPAGENSMRTTMLLSIKALSRAGDVTTIETKTENGKITVPAGSPMAGMKDAMERQMSGKTATSKVDSHYRVVGSTSDMMASMSSGPGGAMSGMSFPNHAVKVGDAWTASLDLGKLGKAAMPGMTMGGSIPIKMKLLAIGGGKATISIGLNGTMTMSMRSGGAGAPGGQKILTKMNGAGVYVVNTADGTLVSSSMTTDSTTAFGKMAMKQHMVQNMTRL